MESPPDPWQQTQNLIITLAVLLLAGYLAFLGAPKEAVGLIVAIGGPVLLWRHSGRRRSRPPRPPGVIS